MTCLTGYTRIILTFSLILATGCGAIKPNPAGISETGNGEELNPFSFGDEFFQNSSQSDGGNESVERDGRNSAAVMGNNPENVSGGSSSSNNSVSPARPVINGETQGWRIQIGISHRENMTEAEELQEYARRRLNFPVYLVFDVPFYKVHVGDFTTEKEAEAELRIIKRNRRFNDALIIKTRINTQ